MTLGPHLLATTSMHPRAKRSPCDGPLSLSRAAAWLGVGAWVAALPACGADHAAPAVRPSVVPSAPTPGIASAEPGPAPGSSAAPEPAVATPPAPLRSEQYAWLAESERAMPAPVDTLAARFAPPAGYTRVAANEGSFAAWLRGLPLAAPRTPVVSYKGSVVLAPDDPRYAAVVAIDVGTADLQQCADAVMRLWGEWSWSRGQRDVSYRLASGAQLPFERYARGERVIADGNRVRWEARAKRGSMEDHRVFRAYLDEVFTWANTGSLERQARKVALDDLRPGDFVVQPGSPGHTVLVLDLARSAGGRRALLLGQSYMPAQSFQVLRPAREDAAPGDPAGVWFAVGDDGPGLTTPFWPTFPWETLHRLD